MAKTKMDPTLKIVIIIIVVLTAISAFFIILGIVLVLLAGPIDSSYTNTSSSETTKNTIEQNNAIVDQAIQQKDPALCDQINGETSVNMPLPGGNKVQTYDEATSKQRCKQQAEAGQPYVY